jgi:hypothetical protein
MNTDETICRLYSENYSPVEDDQTVGISKINQKLYPINGERTKIIGIFSGWMIWFGSEIPQGKTNFESMCKVHLKNKIPLIIPYLSLPPGYRFMIDDKGFEDIWYDEKLLDS